MAAFWESIILLLLPLAVVNSEVIQLEKHNIKLDDITVSGISAGGAMTAQMHVIYSGTFSGAGYFAGVPYWCGQDNLAIAFFNCLSLPASIDVSVLIDKAETNAAAGLVDPTSNLANDNVFIFHGSQDPVVNPGVSNVIVSFYDHFGSLDTPDFGVAAGHAQPTQDYGNACDATSSPFINDCDYDGANKMLTALYGSIKKPSKKIRPTSILAEFNQEEFFAVPDPGLDTTGYIFIPTPCKNGNKLCRLHMALHGCLQGKETIGDVYARNAGYIETAESNNIIIIFPQVKSSPTNPNGCFDWWGYTGSDYATNQGPQPKTLIAMIDRIAGIDRSK